MLLELSVENIAIIDRSRLTLGQGFTALTGETGAGKSLLVDAINLGLGERADSDLVRTGTSKGTVAVLFDVTDSPEVLTHCTELGIEVEDGQLAIHRDLTAEGRSTVRLNGRPSSVGVLKELGSLLVDLHGQHDHQALLVPEKQIDFLDDWIGTEASEILAEISELFRETESLKAKLASLHRSQRDREQRIDMLRFQIDEISDINLLVGESDELQVQIERLKHSARLSEGVIRALNHTVEDPGSASERLGAAIKELESLAVFDPSLNEIRTVLLDAQLNLREGVRALGNYAESLESDPDALESAAQRLDSIKRLHRKYGSSDIEVLQHLEFATKELADLENSDIDADTLRAILDNKLLQLQQLCGQLTEVRTRFAREFAATVTSEIRELAMERAEFDVALTKKPIEANGQDVVTFQFSANQGEDMRPLVKVASGGEISRLMLAIKVAGTGRAGVPTLIFDEVDTGLSGKAAAVTAKKLAQLADHYQVIVISHLPQIAAKASVHFRIEKSSESGRTSTTVTELKGDERVREIARMLAGEAIGDSAIANAHELVYG